MVRIKPTINKLLEMISTIKTKHWLWLFILVVFILAAIFVYANYIKPQIIEMEYKANYEFDKTINNVSNNTGDGSTSQPTPSTPSTPSTPPSDSSDSSSFMSYLISLWSSLASFMFSLFFSSPPSSPTHSDKDAHIYLFWACWCPNSNTNGAQGSKLHSIWDKLTAMKQKDKNTIFGNNITFHKVEETDDDFNDKLKSIGIGEIEGFPSIYISYKQYLQETEQTIVCEFDALPTEENITKFIKDNLDSENVSEMCKKKPT
jgi:hypothetical protein